MSFVTDKQTLDDLNLTGKYRNSSVFNLFNRTKTAGGERLLEQMFRQPLTDAAAINHRSHIFRYFQGKVLTFPFNLDELAAAENYLSGGAAAGKVGAAAQALRRRFLFLLGLKQEHDLVATGLVAAIKMLKQLQSLVTALLKQDPAGPVTPELRKVQQFLDSTAMNGLAGISTEKSLSFFQTIRYDHLLRAALRTEIENALRLIHELDVNIAVAAVAAEKNLCYANALPATENRLEIEDGFHPAIERAVPNSVYLNAASNMIFLTGANMAGKSTFMKSFGIAMYLGHMGFPVPAKSMMFSVKEGMFTSINVPDNLNMGYSHFYAEVLRVKNIAEAVSTPKNLVVIFDELFKGTNVKDAYDATLAVAKAFGDHRNCFFIVSTHIVEVGEELKQQTNNTQYCFMPTEMEGSKPVYTYKAQQGISSDRHGMMIIRNERILEILE